MDPSSHYELKTAETKWRHIVDVPFINQYYHWDCGLACVCMILRMFDEPCSDVYTKDLDSLQCGESIWTIDLAYILDRHNIQNIYYTITLGVDSSHSSKLFYKNTFSEDQNRVNKMFSNASRLEIPVHKRSVSMEELVKHLAMDNPIIVLVDWSHMQCLECGTKLAKCWSCITCNHGPYQGHFIVLCGFDERKRIMYFKNPDARCHDVCCVSMDQLEKARRRDGTDEDLIFIFRNSPNTQALAAVQTKYDNSSK